jgi:hypothetical protein
VARPQRVTQGAGPGRALAGICVRRFARIAIGDFLQFTTEKSTVALDISMTFETPTEFKAKTPNDKRQMAK